MNPYFLLYVVSVTVASLSQLLLKKSAMKQHASLWAEYVNPYVIGGYGLLFVSMFLTILAFRGMEYKNGAMIEALGYVMVLLLSRIFFGERLTGQKILGTICILTGIAVFYL